MPTETPIQVCLKATPDLYMRPYLSLSQWKVPGWQMVQSLSSLPSAQYSW